MLRIPFTWTAPRYHLKKLCTEGLDGDARICFVFYRDTNTGNALTFQLPPHQPQVLALQNKAIASEIIMYLSSLKPF